MNMKNEINMENVPLPEKYERFEAETKTLTADELEDTTYRGERLPQDKRFLDEEKGGVFKYFDLNKLIERKMYKRELFYPVAEFGGEIVGLGELERKPDKESAYWMTFVSVDPEYQGRECASRLEEEIFRFAKENNITIESSRYSPEGWEKLKPFQNKLAEKYGVRFIDSEEKMID